MTDTRQVLEEAFKVIHPAPRPIRHAYQPDGSHWPGDGIGPYTEEYGAWSKVLARFRRFLDAEAWTDAALMLVPEGWEWAYLDNAAIVREAGTLKHAYGNAPIPALAIAQAALRAQEAGDEG